MNKLKVLLITGFSSEELRSHLRFRNVTGLDRTLIKLFKLPYRVIEHRDKAPWAGALIKELEQRNDIDLTVVTAEFGLTSPIQRFETRGVKYYSYRTDFSGILRMIKNYPVWKRLQRSGYYFKKILNQVCPDIVVVCGAENPVTSITALYAKKYPVWCLCQTIYFNPERGKYTAYKTLNLKVEEEIHKSLRYLGVTNRMHYDLLRERAKEAYVFDFRWPRNPYPKVESLTKYYDFINFAFHMDDRKGGLDSIKALAIVKEKYPNVLLNITGGLDGLSYEKMRNMVKEFDLEQNVSFTPFFPSKKDLLQHIVKARFAVLPVKLDSIPGTVMEAMFYNIPVITNATTGTPRLNINQERVLLAEKNNIQSLSTCMLKFMDNPDYAQNLAIKAKAYSDLQQNNTPKVERFISVLNAITSHYKQVTPIPNELLFDTVNFPKY